MVSVIIPCYNQAIYLEESVRSVINSTHKDLEIIIVNDGSTDQTEEIAARLQQQYPFVSYYFQDNKGPSAARNLGIKNATGQYILPLDADDYISDRYIAEAVKILDQQPHVKVVTCEAEFVGERSGRWILPNFSLEKLVRRNLLIAASFFRKSDWERIGGYDEKMTWSLEDWEFWLALLKDGGDVCKLPIVGFYYRISKNTRTENARNEGLALTISYLNQKHHDFIYSKLGGPLRRRKKMSKIINLITGTTLFIKLGLKK